MIFKKLNGTSTWLWKKYWQKHMTLTPLTPLSEGELSFRCYASSLIPWRWWLEHKKHDVLKLDDWQQTNNTSIMMSFRSCPNCLLSFFGDLHLHQKTAQLSCERSLPFLRLSGKQPFPGFGKKKRQFFDVWETGEKDEVSSSDVRMTWWDYSTSHQGWCYFGAISCRNIA